MEHAAQITCGIIGAGHLGTALALGLNSIDLLDFVVARNEVKAKKLIELGIPNEKIVDNINKISSIPQVLFFAVNDKAIIETAAQLSSRFDDFHGKLVGHCSGVADISELNSLKDKGAKLFSAHPYQTFFYPDVTAFNDIYWLIDSSIGQLEQLELIIKKLNGYYVYSNSNIDKVKYHASAVVASNFLTPLFSLAKDLAFESGIDPEKFLMPIMLQTLKNNFKSLNEKDALPLTGPIARSDIETIKRHLDSLEFDKNTKNAYIGFALASLTIAKSSGVINETDYIELIELLESKK